MIKSSMSLVADKIGVLAATRYCEAADCGSGEVASSPHLRFAHREPMPIARSATKVVARTCPHDTVRRSRLVREWGAAAFPAPKGSAPPCQGRYAEERDTASARFCRNPDGHGLCGRSAVLRCGCETLLRSSRLRERGRAGHPAPSATHHRVRPATPQSRVRGHVGLNRRFLKFNKIIFKGDSRSEHHTPDPNFSLILRLTSIFQQAIEVGHFAAVRPVVPFFAAFSPLASFSWQSLSDAFRMCNLFWPFSFLILCKFS